MPPSSAAFSDLYEVSSPSKERSSQNRMKRCGASRSERHQLGQRLDVLAVDLDQLERRGRSACVEAGMDRLDQRALAHAARAPQQRVVGRQAAREALGVLEQDVAQPVDALEQVDLDPVDLGDRLQAAAGRDARRRRPRRRNRALARPAAPPARSGRAAGRDARRWRSRSLSDKENPSVARAWQTGGRVSTASAPPPSGAIRSRPSPISFAKRGRPAIVRAVSGRSFAAADDRSMSHVLRDPGLCGRRRPRRTPAFWAARSAVPAADRPDLRDHVFPASCARSSRSSASTAR